MDTTEPNTNTNITMDITSQTFNINKTINATIDIIYEHIKQYIEICRNYNNMDNKIMIFCDASAQIVIKPGNTPYGNLIIFEILHHTAKLVNFILDYLREKNINVEVWQIC